MAPILREPSELEQDETAVQEQPSPASRRRVSRVSHDDMTVRRSTPSLWPVLTALAAGCVVASLILAASLRVEFPLYSEASAERGRDCTKIASARHALDAALQAYLPLRTLNADAVGSIHSAILTFDADTQDLATPSVRASLDPVRHGLDALSDSIAIYAASADTPLVGDRVEPAANDAIQGAFAQVTRAWQGPIARVCS